MKPGKRSGSSRDTKGKENVIGGKAEERCSLGSQVRVSRTKENLMIPNCTNKFSSREDCKLASYSAIWKLLMNLTRVIKGCGMGDSMVKLRFNI